MLQKRKHLQGLPGIHIDQAAYQYPQNPGYNNNDSSCSLWNTFTSAKVGLLNPELTEGFGIMRTAKTAS
ncbi:MAG: hypothetical protein JWN92_1722, partial [Candidatus Acidoferrum typicum]|nr:hypothetical protein [Candidatus Acidoferrum typicum]